MKKIIKKFLEKNKNYKFINYYFFQEKFHRLDFSLFLINFIFQRILRLNSNTKWMVNFTSRVIFPENIIIHDIRENASVLLSFSSPGNCYFQAINGIEIHKNVIWACGVKLISANHNINNLDEHDKCKPIIINQNVWLGADVVVLPGVEVGKFAIVGSGSVVTKNIPAFTIVGGNPAKILFYRCKKCHGKLNNFECIQCKLTFSKGDYI